MFSLSILYLRCRNFRVAVRRAAETAQSFNSLFEMRLEALATEILREEVVLSILYLRCDDPPAVEARRRLR